MGYHSLKQCVLDLEQAGHLIRIKEEVDPELEMAAIHLRVYEQGGPALLFENVKGSNFQAASNLFGTLERSRFMFRDSLQFVQDLIKIKQDPAVAFKNPFRYAPSILNAYRALPRKSKGGITFSTCSIDDLPATKSWPNDGGRFITLPQVYTEDMDQPGIMNSNLGMYRIQLDGNDYVHNKEIGLHYQLHRGIGVHHTKAENAGKPLKVSIFVGGPPAHTFSAVMPLPEGISELTFAGALGKRRFHYMNKEGYVLSSDADFVITGEVHPGNVKPEGPFGDHLGYYSLAHNFPLMKVHKVWHKKDAIWPFTVVGRPPQEDTAFGKLIHELTGDAIPNEIPGLKAVNAVDEAGVHPLLLAIGSERYTPYQELKQPSELLTLANHILGKGQLSLAKYLMIANQYDDHDLDVNDIPSFFRHMLERVNLERDIHFHTNTSIDTLDYSGSGLNYGSKVVIAAVGDKRRSLATEVPDIVFPGMVQDADLVEQGILALQISKYADEAQTKNEINALSGAINPEYADTIPLIVLVDDVDFVSRRFANFIWVTFTRSNPAVDIHGIKDFIYNKHWGCKGPLVIDARIKPHHAPVLKKDTSVEKMVDALGQKGKSLYGII